MIERYITLSCVSNEVGGDLIGNATWLGVPLKDLLEEAGPDAGADQVVSRSVDGFSAGTPTKALLDGRDAMLAMAMNGEPLPIEHAGKRRELAGESSALPSAPEISRSNRSNSARACSTLIPCTPTVIIDAEATEIAQPAPSKVAAAMRSSSAILR